MATVLLQAAGGALGSFLGGPIGGLIGRSIGGLIGSVVDSYLLGIVFAPAAVQQQGPRLSGVQLQASQEGQAITRTYGRIRIAPEIVWATRFKETTSTTTSGGGKGGGGQKVVTTTYNYYCSFAAALCTGPILGIGRIWADGKPMDLTGVTYRLYLGTETQAVDPKIAATEGVAFAPAFRGVAYIVFEELLLEKYGNRIPQINVEVYSRASPTITGDELEEKLRGVTVIPGLSEFAYATDQVVNSGVAIGGTSLGWGNANAAGDTIINSNGERSGSDFTNSINDLKMIMTGVDAVSLVVAWHFTDLRVGVSQVRPKVETASKTTTPWSWQVSGITRAGAQVVSQDANGALLGGAPADRSVFQAIQYLTSKGYRIMFYPFIIGDIPSGNTLPNPYSDNAAGVGQAVFPWRGRITCSPSRGYVGTVDKTAAATTQVNTFFGTTLASSFGAWNGDTIPFSGSGTDWSYRRMILHYAKLCAAAGGIQSFLIGSELVELNRIRGTSNSFPAVAQLVTLAADVAGILGGSVKVGYAADWSEYCSFRPTDGSNDVFFHLDPLWSSSSISFIGIDNYMPLSDWRSIPGHIDGNTYDTIYDLNYLQSNIEGGEYYTWYYASQADRDNQVRTAITDGAYSKPWVFRQKDMRNWWLNQHFDRPAGVESGSPTAWVPQSKPIWFTEYGCPSIDKGTNQPNVFVDPKSSESAYPYYSTRARDPLIQRRYLDSIHSYWATPANNPTSTVYSAPMADVANFYVWTWDARPYPDFPNKGFGTVWRDGDNWQTGHWLTGRMGMAPVDKVAADLCSNLPVTLDTSKLVGLMYGYKIERAMSPREALNTLATTFMFDAYESGGVIRFALRGGKSVQTLTVDDLIDDKGDYGPFLITRAQETDLPLESSIQFTESNGSYDVGSVFSRRTITTATDRTSSSEIAAVMDRDMMQQISDILLMDVWIQREKLACVLPPSMLKLDPSDVVTFNLNGRIFDVRIEELGYEFIRSMKGSRTDRSTYYRVPTTVQKPPIGDLSKPVAGSIDFLDLPMLTDTDDPYAPWIALFANPWVTYNVFRSPTTNFTLDVDVLTPAIVGLLVNPLSAGPEGIWDLGNTITVQLLSTTVLQSLADIEVFSGRNAAAIKCSNGEWEIVQWRNATIVAAQTWSLTGLLRAQMGTENAMNSGAAASSGFVLLDNILQSTVGSAQFKVPLNWKFGPASKDIGDTTYRQVAYTPQGINQRPLSPVQLSASRTGVNDLTLSWIRRDRKGADNWEVPNIPMSESMEAYDIEIYNVAGTAIVRTITDNPTASFVYTSAMQVADLSVNVTTLKYTVYQKSSVYGRGMGRTKTVIT